MSDIFDTDVSGISRHIQNIFEEGEVSELGNLHFLQIANSAKPVNFYSLDVIISVGYRVNRGFSCKENLYNCQRWEKI